MISVTNAAQDLIDAVTNILTRDDDALPDLAMAVQEAAEQAAEADITTAARIVADVLPTVETSYAGFMAVILGALIEHGAEPAVATDAFLTRLPDMLELTVEFIEGCEEYAEEMPDEDSADDREMAAAGGIGEDMELPDGRYVPAATLDAISVRLPEAAAAYGSMDRFALGTIALLSRCPAARKRARQNADLHEMAERVGEKFLWMMLQVVDDEPLIVLHPELRRGYRVQISGISDNFQLHTLLAAELVGNAADGLLPGKKPDTLAISVARGLAPQNPNLTAEGQWNLYNWVAIKPDGTLSDELMTSTDGWIWGEGIPAEILPFEGTRVVLLGPAPYLRSWSANRIFEGMKADLKLMEILGAEDVAGWIARLARAPR